MEVSNEHKSSSEKTPKTSPPRYNGTDVNNEKLKSKNESIDSR